MLAEIREVKQEGRFKQYSAKIKWPYDEILELFNDLYCPITNDMKQEDIDKFYDKKSKIGKLLKAVIINEIAKKLNIESERILLMPDTSTSYEEISFIVYL